VARDVEEQGNIAAAGLFAEDSAASNKVAGEAGPLLQQPTERGYSGKNDLRNAVTRAGAPVSVGKEWLPVG